MTHEPATHAPSTTMSDADRHPFARAGRNLTKLLFVVTLVVFLVGGFAIVIAQAVEIVAGDGTAVTAIGEKLGPPVFTVSAICGLLAFVMEYLAPTTGDAGSD